MKFHLSIWVISLFIPILTQSECPNGIRQRPNYLTMTKVARDKFHKAIKVLNSPKEKNIYSKFSRIHDSVGFDVHGTPAFFVWHRKFIREFEKMLQKVDETIMLPYWDWTQDSQAPEKSKIFALANMGPNGGEGDGGCIDKGTFSGWKVPSNSSECVSRFFANGKTIPAWTAPEIMDNDLNSNSRYVDIWGVVESTSHALIHTGIGGEEGDMSYMFSPNDPIFWIHHGFVDYIYWEWQLRHPQMANDYPTNPNTTRLAIYNSTVASALNTKAPGYCYTYPSRWKVSAPKVDATTLPKNTLKVGSLMAAEVSDSPSPLSSQSPSITASQKITGTAISSSPTPTTSGLETCPTGDFGIILGCRNNRRALDLRALLSQIIHFPGFIDPNDRTVLNKIRVPARVPAFFIKSNHIDPVKALENHLKAAIIACKLNLLPNFKPIVSL